MSGAPDRLTIQGLRCMCHIGVTEEERSVRQRLEVDVDLYLPLLPAGRSGDLAQTLDYRVACDTVRALLEGGSFHLVEAAATEVLDQLFERFRTVRRAVVRVRKYVLPDVAHVEVEMERSR